MASKGHYTKPPEWWKHLRWTKRMFWKAERKAGKHDGTQRAHEESSNG